MRSIFVSGICATAVALFLFAVVDAASLTVVSDTISTSAPGTTTSTHTIQFTATNDIPASGRIVVTPENGDFTIPVGLDYLDVDFAVATSTVFVDRGLDATAGTATSGVSVVTGTSGSITIELGSTQSVSAGNDVQIEIGTNATEGGTGDTNITNPSTAGSYRILIQTQNSSAQEIDRASAMVVMIAPITVSGIIDSQQPVLFNGLPSGEIPSGNANIQLSVETANPATCRYSTVASTTYASMTDQFSTPTGVVHFSPVIGGHADDTAYIYYVRCEDFSSMLANDSDYLISFNLKETATSTIGDPDSDPDDIDSAGPGGIGSFRFGSPRLYLSDIHLRGWGSPLTQLVFLQDGDAKGSVNTDGDGLFDFSIKGLERGTYTFGVYAVDQTGETSGTFSSTLTLESGSQNTISNIIVPPITMIEAERIDIGGTVRIFGTTVPGKTVEVTLTRQGATAEEGEVVYTASSTPTGGEDIAGTWEVTADSADLQQGTYRVRAHTIFDGDIKSDPSKLILLGMGEDATADFFDRSDINKDGSVNLTDFSILLSNWGGTDENSDINLDGAINLSDVSIQLFNWTG